VSTNPDNTHPLDDPVHFLKGVGEQRAKSFAKLNVTTIRQLLYHIPRRYEDRSQFLSLKSIKPGEFITFRGKVLGVRLIRLRGAYRSIFEVTIQEGRALQAIGTTVAARWFNVPYFQNFFKTGDDVILYGKIKIDSKNRLTVDHPDFEVLEKDEDESIHIGRITPVYPASEGLPVRLIRTLMHRTLAQFARDIEEIYPSGFIKELDMFELREAVQKVHFPSSLAEASKARERLAFDELYLMQVVISQKRAKTMLANGIAHELNGAMTSRLLGNLPFSLTEAQEKVIREITTDLKKPHPMHRLLQGDVGSGKTVVAAHTILQVIESGYQAALMAPTEILAEQHAINFRRWFEPLGIKVALRTANKKSSLKLTDSGHDLFVGGETKKYPDLVIGTHALIQDSVEFPKLGLVVIDEQHKFGVLQRSRLTSKGKGVDVLVMTATPIPRTLSLTLYGDLDVSVIDEMPKNRGVIKTAVRKDNKLPEIFDFMKKHLAKGRQAYIVYPLVEESDKLPLKAVTKEFENLKVVFSGFNLSLLHGKLKSEEKEEVMRGFRAGQTHILVSTTVIEVGVDVANANMMLIENAERFGLAQLHQLRGRIGRGEHHSFCILVGSAKSLEGYQRLKIMEETVDGFKIAEADLQIRGPGNIFGTEQSGLPPLEIADLIKDAKILYLARQKAGELIALDPDLKTQDNRPLRNRIKEVYGRSKSLLAVG